MNQQRIIKTLEAHGCSWREFILVGKPPDVSICRWSNGLSALIIEDDTLARETVEFLTLQGARRFGTLSEVERAFTK